MNIEQVLRDPPFSELEHVVVESDITLDELQQALEALTRKILSMGLLRGMAESAVATIKPIKNNDQYFAVQKEPLLNLMSTIKTLTGASYTVNIEELKFDD